MDWRVGDVLERREESYDYIQIKRYRVTAIGEDGWLARETYYRQERRAIDDNLMHVTFEMTFTKPAEVYLSAYAVGCGTWTAMTP